jgi:hypothetical protein
MISDLGVADAHRFLDTAFPAFPKAVHPEVFHDLGTRMATLVNFAAEAQAGSELQSSPAPTDSVAPSTAASSSIGGAACSSAQGRPEPTLVPVQAKLEAGLEALAAPSQPNLEPVGVTPSRPSMQLDIARRLVKNAVKSSREQKQHSVYHFLYSNTPDLEPSSYARRRLVHRLLKQHGKTIAKHCVVRCGMDFQRGPSIGEHSKAAPQSKAALREHLFGFGKFNFNLARSFDLLIPWTDKARSRASEESLAGSSKVDPPGLFAHSPEESKALRDFARKHPGVLVFQSGKWRFSSPVEAKLAGELMVSLSTRVRAC